MDTLGRNIKEAELKASLAQNVLIGMYREAAIMFEHESHESVSAADIAALYCRLHSAETPGCTDISFALFCSEFAPIYSSRGGLLFPDVESENTQASPSISYLQNSFSDRAFRAFSSQFSRVTAQYFPGFREVCEELYYGRSTHAILPIYSTNDGYLTSFRKLISKYDLKITTATDVEMNDDSLMRFALLKKGLDRHHIDERSAENHVFLDISVVLPYGMKHGSFLASCESLGADLITSNSHPLEYSDDICGISYQFDVTDADLGAMYLFFEGLQIRYDTLGLYNII